MPNFVSVCCEYCGKEFLRSAGEVNRSIRVGRRFFCNDSCAAKLINSERPNRRRPIEKICPLCGGSFTATTGSHEATFCSRSCASKGSVTKVRRDAARCSGLKSAAVGSFSKPEFRAAALRKREFWKYRRLDDFLNGRRIPHVFEFLIGRRRIFDLAFVRRRLLVEFDAKYHTGKQLDDDAKKTAYAERKGWRVIRISVPHGVIDPSVLKGLV